MKLIVKDEHSTEIIIDVPLDQIHKVVVKGLKANKDNIVQGGYINLYINDLYYPKCGFTISPAKRLSIRVSNRGEFTAWL